MLLTENRAHSKLQTAGQLENLQSALQTRRLKRCDSPNFSVYKNVRKTRTFFYSRKLSRYTISRKKAKLIFLQLLLIEKVGFENPVFVLIELRYFSRFTSVCPHLQSIRLTISRTSLRIANLQWFATMFKHLQALKHESVRLSSDRSRWSSLKSIKLREALQIRLTMAVEFMESSVSIRVYYGKVVYKPPRVRYMITAVRSKIAELLS